MVDELIGGGKIKDNDGYIWIDGWMDVQTDKWID